VLSVLLSYAVSRYRPRLSFAKAREIWGFSQWLLVTNIGYYAYTRADQFIIGGTVGKANLGTYSVAAEVAELPTTEVIAALSRVVLPGLAKIKGEPARLTEAFLRVHGVTASLVFPAAAGLAVTAPELVPVLLGDKWLQSVTVLQWLAVYTGLRTLYGSVGNLMIVKGAMSTLALVTWLELLAIVGSTLVGGYLGGLVGIAAAKVVLACGMAIVWYGLARSRCQVPLGAVLSTFARPALATLGMVGVVVAVSSVAGGPAPLRLLLLKSLLGVLSYVALLAVTWHLWCRPDGPERAVVDLLARLLHPASHR
jgi:O-antigen/teichoic acid export membrane protein